MDKVLQALLMTDYAAYCAYVHHGTWKATPFHKYLCMIVQNFIEADTGHAYDILVLSTPPQVGKSVTVTETLPSWLMGRNPESRIIEISYSEDFAKRFGRRNKQKIEEFGNEIFGIQIGDPNTNLDFELKGHRGGMISRGALSGVTGKSADYMIIDDPVKNREEADSETQRDKLWDEWQNSYKTRFQAHTKVILIMTRWHEDDLAGRIIANEENVTVVNIPLEAEENDPLGRKVGDAICPEIGKDNDWLKDFKKGFMSKEGSRAWNALFQGHPTGLEGNLFKREWWQYYDELPEISYWCMSVDAAFKDGEDNDFVAIQVWGKTRANMYLVDRVKAHLNLPDTIREIVRLRNMYPMCKTTLIEDKANGSAIINILRKDLTGIIAVNPKGGKIARANAIVGAVESGNVFLPSNKRWVGEYIEEFAAFPNGAHDDECDSTSQALNHMIYSKSELKSKTPIDIMEKFFPGYKPKSKATVGRGSKIRRV